MSKTFNSLLAISLMGLATSANAARNDRCEPEPGATCYPDDCQRCYCLGPENTAVNPPVRPKTCDGDLFIEVAGFYWNAHQDGMEYAVQNHVRVLDPIAEFFTQSLNNLIDADYKDPDFKWDFGFKAALGYNSPCDGWDIGVYWTWYKGRASSHDESETDDNTTLIALWSAYSPPVFGEITYATDIQTDWDLKLNLVDVELGREFWVSKYLTLRPHVGLRFARLDQEFIIKHKGGSFSEFSTDQFSFNNEVDLDNEFKGIGVRAGLDTVWNFGCGWGLYGDFAASIVYGRFSVRHDESNRHAAGNHDKVKILETHESFRASRAMLDLALGLQWATLFCDCKYGFTVQLGWEHHMFFNQNQMWRVVRIDDTFDFGIPNDSGENVFHQRRGSLDTQGWTLSVRFDF